MSSTRKFKLRAFQIENTSLKSNSSDVLRLLNQKLKSSILQDRRLILNPNDPGKEEDLICNYLIPKEKYVFGTMLRIRSSENLVDIPNNSFKESTIEIESLDYLELESDMIYHSHYYFLLDDDYLITTLRGNITIKRLQTYINWILEDLREDIFYEFTPLITTQPDFNLSELRSVKFIDPAINDDITGVEKSYIEKKNLPLKWLKKILNDVKSLDTIALSEIISAELVFKFVKPTSMNKKDYQRALSAQLKPVSDTDNVIYYPKKGRPVKGDDLLRVKEVEIDTTESAKISEEDLRQEMEKFLIELHNENNY